MKSHICWCVIDYTFMVIDYQWLFSKNSFPKVTFLQVTCFWRFFQKSYLFKWLVLKELPRVTSFDLSHQETINMWPWHETKKTISFIFVISFNHSIFQSIFQHLLSATSLFQDVETSHVTSAICSPCLHAEEEEIRGFQGFCRWSWPEELEENHDWNRRIRFCCLCALCWED